MIFHYILSIGNACMRMYAYTIKEKYKASCRGLIIRSAFKSIMIVLKFNGILKFKKLIFQRIF